MRGKDSTTVSVGDDVSSKGTGVGAIDGASAIEVDADEHD